MTTTDSIQGSLTMELRRKDSPVRKFLDARFTSGLRPVQNQFRASAPADLLVPPNGANPGTVGTATDWLMRFRVHPQPSLHLAAGGVVSCLEDAGINLREAWAELFAEAVGSHRPDAGFAGPCAGSVVQTDRLVRICWALALLTEVFRAGPYVLAAGPLSRLRGHHPCRAADLLGLADDAACAQLTALDQQVTDRLLPALADRRGTWASGPSFTGSALLNADADLIAAGLLLDLKTSAQKLCLSREEVYQLIGYALLDFDDEYGIKDVGIFNARYAHLVCWELRELLAELADKPVDLAAERAAFRVMLERATPYL